MKIEEWPSTAKWCQAGPNGAKQGQTGPNGAKKCLMGPNLVKRANVAKRGHMGSYGADFLRAQQQQVEALKQQ